MVIHVYYIQVYSWCNFTFMNIHEYSGYKTGIIHDYSRNYTMNILELHMSKAMLNTQHWLL